MLGGSCNPCCAFCGCDIAPSQVLLTLGRTSRDIISQLIGPFVVRDLATDGNNQLKQAVVALGQRGGVPQCVAVRDDSVAPYNGYGFRFLDDTPDTANAFSVDILSGGGVPFYGSFSSGTYVSRPGVVATMNVVRVALGGALFAYFVENNPSHPQADRNGKPYCVKFGGSLSESWAIYNAASGQTPATASTIATLSLTVADSNLAFNTSYPALYKSARAHFFSLGVGTAPERRTFPSPYLCLPRNAFAAHASLFIPQFSNTFLNDFGPGNGGVALIEAVFAGDGIPTTFSGDQALGP